MKTAAVCVLLAIPAVPVLARAQGMTMEMGGGPAGTAFGESMQRMMKGMDVKPTGNPDKDFVSMMMPHHQGAIDMARVELRYGKDPVLRRMAADIVEAQEREIGEMKAWQARTGK